MTTQLPSSPLPTPLSLTAVMTKFMTCPSFWACPRTWCVDPFSWCLICCRHGDAETLWGGWDWLPLGLSRVSPKARWMTQRAPPSSQAASAVNAQSPELQPAPIPPPMLAPPLPAPASLSSCAKDRGRCCGDAIVIISTTAWVIIIGGISYTCWLHHSGK